MVSSGEFGELKFAKPLEQYLALGKPVRWLIKCQRSALALFQGLMLLRSQSPWESMAVETGGPHSVFNKARESLCQVSVGASVSIIIQLTILILALMLPDLTPWLICNVRVVFPSLPVKWECLGCRPTPYSSLLIGYYYCVWLEMGVRVQWRLPGEPGGLSCKNRNLAGTWECAQVGSR